MCVSGPQGPRALGVSNTVICMYFEDVKEVIDFNAIIMPRYRSIILGYFPSAALQLNRTYVFLSLICGPS